MDPDNRRPVDFDTRIALLDGLRRAEEEQGTLNLVRELLGGMEDGRVKFFLTWKSLAYRREHRRLFEEGKYLSLEVEGERAEHVCAFERYVEGETLLAVAPRFFTRLTGRPDGLPLGGEVWGDTRLVLPFETAGSASLRNHFGVFLRDFFLRKSPRHPPGTSGENVTK